jgi:glucose/arabinose dehydrogenase
MRSGLCLALGVTIAASVAAVTAGADASRTAKIPLRPLSATQIGSFDFPVHVTAPPGDTRRLFVVEKAGTIRVVRDGTALPTPFLDIRDEVAPGNEPGLLSLAFSPAYAENGLFYVYYAGTDRRTHLLELRRSTADPNRADPGTRREVLSFEHLSGEHFGGLLLFGPDRGLYLSTGDGGFTEWQDKMRAQRPSDPNGKILRVVVATGATRVIARGLRNPWRFTIDETTGDLYVGDAGELVRESIDYAPRSLLPGANFGWPCFEGGLAHERFPPRLCPKALPPLLEYAREGGNCSVIGGVVMHDPRLPAFDGRYVYADYCLGEVILLGVRDGKLATRRSTRIYLPGVTSFGKDAQGRVYAAIATGAVIRLDRNTAATARPENGLRSGEELFLASGCGSCHTLRAAGTVGGYGPNLDSAKPSRATVIDRVTWGRKAMPYFKGRLSEAEIEAVADFVTAAS